MKCIYMLSEYWNKKTNAVNSEINACIFLCDFGITAIM